MLVASSAGDLTQAEMRESGCGVDKLTNQMIKDIAVAEGYRVYLVFFDSKASSSARRGKDPADEISVDALLTKSNGSPVCFDVTD
ncbi:MAG: hypothetical protein MJ246_00790 [Clostridia bacterium]|nr:hypothetical protein [Clostridia bacterium]